VGGADGSPVTVGRRTLDLGILAALATLAVLTLSPDGTGWTWGAPLAELRWYVTGWTAGTTLLQLLGNLALLVPLFVLAVLRWPGPAVPRRLVPAALAVASGIEALQWALPLGRVVSPLDALLNATGGVLAGLAVALLRPARYAPGTP
jgi:hypothetical protein